jgi:hypothetical protein
MMRDIRLIELDPVLLRMVSEKQTAIASDLRTADGIMFLCPKCFRDAGFTAAGVHRIKCWRPHVPQSMPPVPGRWEMMGSGLVGLSLVNPGRASSVLLTSGCKAHFHITNGIVKWCK